jgi:hypothetical protein
MVKRSWNHKDLTGKRFERLSVIGLQGKSSGHLMWTCKCDCGKEITVRGSSLTSGNGKSCGCLHSELAKISAKEMGTRYGGWNWKGGINKYPKRWEEIRVIIKQRDGNKCVFCHKHEHLNVHHIDENPKNCEFTNLVTVCKSCHGKLHNGRKTMREISNEFKI